METPKEGLATESIRVGGKGDSGTHSFQQEAERTDEELRDEVTGIEGHIQAPSKGEGDVGDVVADSAHGEQQVRNEENETGVVDGLNEQGTQTDILWNARNEVTPTEDSGPSDSSPGATTSKEGRQIFCGKIPKEMPMGEIANVFEKVGEVTDVHVPIDPVTNQNRGFAFVTYERKEEARTAIQQLNNFQIRPDVEIKVERSNPNLRLFVGNIPKAKTQEEIFREFSVRTIDLKEVIIYRPADEQRHKNRGFCFLEYETHRAAYHAKRRLTFSQSRIWGCDIMVDWADPLQEVDEEVMAQVKILFVRNIPNSVQEEELHDIFSQYGQLERVKKLKDYAFIHFETREQAAKALEALQGTMLRGNELVIAWSKPPTDKEAKTEMLRARDRRILHLNAITPVRGQYNPLAFQRLVGGVDRPARVTPPAQPPGDYMGTGPGPCPSRYRNCAMRPWRNSDWSGTPHDEMAGEDWDFEEEELASQEQWGGQYASQGRSRGHVGRPQAWNDRHSQWLQQNQWHMRGGSQSSNKSEGYTQRQRGVTSPGGTTHYEDGDGNHLFEDSPPSSSHAQYCPTPRLASLSPFRRPSFDYGTSMDRQGESQEWRGVNRHASGVIQPPYNVYQPMFAQPRRAVLNSKFQFKKAENEDIDGNWRDRP